MNQIEDQYNYNLRESMTSFNYRITKKQKKVFFIILNLQLKKDLAVMPCSSRACIAIVEVVGLLGNNVAK